MDTFGKFLDLILGLFFGIAIGMVIGDILPEPSHNTSIETGVGIEVKTDHTSTVIDNNNRARLYTSLPDTLIDNGDGTISYKAYNDSGKVYYARVPKPW